MVHGQLIQEGRVEKLSYRQVRRLEKIDRDKAREQALVQLADTTIRAAGQAAEGAFAGLGLAMQGFLTGDAAAFLLKSAAGGLFMQWLIWSYPQFARLTHLDGFPGTPPSLPPSDDALGGYGIRVFYFNGTNKWYAYDTIELRDRAWSVFTNPEYQLINGIAQVNAGYRLVLKGHDLESTEQEAFMRLSVIRSQGINGTIAYDRANQVYYVNYPPYVGPWQ